jgi:hypothetical protein
MSQNSADTLEIRASTSRGFAKKSLQMPSKFESSTGVAQSHILREAAAA